MKLTLADCTSSSHAGACKLTTARLIRQPLAVQSMRCSNTAGSWPPLTAEVCGVRGVRGGIKGLCVGGKHPGGDQGRGGWGGSTRAVTKGGVGGGGLRRAWRRPIVVVGFYPANVLQGAAARTGQVAPTATLSAPHLWGPHCPHCPHRPGCTDGQLAHAQPILFRVQAANGTSR